MALSAEKDQFSTGDLEGLEETSPLHPNPQCDPEEANNGDRPADSNFQNNKASGSLNGQEDLIDAGTIAAENNGDRPADSNPQNNEASGSLKSQEDLIEAGPIAAEPASGAHEKSNAKDAGQLSNITQPRKSYGILHDWWLEILSCILVVAALLATIATILPFQEKPLPQLRYSLSINSLISIYAVTIKAACYDPGRNSGRAKDGTALAGAKGT